MGDGAPTAPPAPAAVSSHRAGSGALIASFMVLPASEFAAAMLRMARSQRRSWEENLVASCSIVLQPHRQGGNANRSCGHHTNCRPS